QLMQDVERWNRGEISNAGGLIQQVDSWNVEVRIQRDLSDLVLSRFCQRGEPELRIHQCNLCGLDSHQIELGFCNLPREREPRSIDIVSGDRLGERLNVVAQVRWGEEGRS